MKKKIIIYGNCHTGLIIEYLMACVDFRKNYEIVKMPQIQDIFHSKSIRVDDIDFNRCDIFVHQAIWKDNVYGEQYSSEHIIDKLSDKCMIISIPNLYGLPLYLFPQCNREDNISHDNLVYGFRDAIIDEFIGKEFTLEQIITAYNDADFYTKEFLDEKWRKFVDKLIKRQKDWDINITDYILQNKNRKMFLDPNHPSNELVEFIVTELCRILQVKIDINAVKKYVTYKLDSYEMPLCASVLQNFNIKKEKFIKTSRYGRKICHKNMSLEEYIKQYVILLWLNGELGINNDFTERLCKKSVAEERLRYPQTLFRWYSMMLYKRSMREINREVYGIISRITGR